MKKVSGTYKDPVCNFMVKDLENEIAETTTSLKNCPPAGQTGGTQSSVPPKAAAARAKECEQYERKLKLTKGNLLHVKEQCDKGLTPDSLPKVIEDPNAVPCAQCGANKAPPREPSAKVFTGLPVSGKVLDLKAGDPNLRTVFGKSAATPALAAAGVPPVGEPYVDCVCPDGRSLGWMYESECTSKRVTSCGATQPPIVPPPTEPPPVVQPPTEPPSTGQPPPVVQPPAENPGLWGKIKNGFKKVWEGIKSLIFGEDRPLTDSEIAEAKKIFGDKIDYSKVRIVTKRMGLWGKLVTSLTPAGSAATSGYTIYYPGYTPGNLGDSSVLLHEMTHIYQQETHSWLGYQWGKLTGGNGSYTPPLIPGKSFNDYKFEEQGAIVQAYSLGQVVRPSGGKTPRPLTPDEKAFIETMLKNAGLLK